MLKPTSPKNNHLLQNCVYVQASQYTPVLRLSRLPPAQKQALWAGIKHHQSALADLLLHDPNIKNLKQHFQAELVLTEAEINQITIK